MKKEDTEKLNFKKERKMIYTQLKRILKGLIH